MNHMDKLDPNKIQSNRFHSKKWRDSQESKCSRAVGRNNKGGGTPHASYRVPSST